MDRSSHRPGRIGSRTPTALDPVSHYRDARPQLAYNLRLQHRQGHRSFLICLTATSVRSRHLTGNQFE
jgi:hypothetical protein